MMPYSKEELSSAIAKYFPYWKKSKVSRPVALRYAALEAWSKNDDCIEVEIMRSAYNDLNTKGQFCFSKTEDIR